MVERERVRGGKREKERGERRERERDVNTSKRWGVGGACNTQGGEVWYVGVVCICLSKVTSAFCPNESEREKRGRERDRSKAWPLPPSRVHLSLHLKRRVQRRGREGGIVRHGLRRRHVREDRVGHSAHWKVSILLLLLDDGVNVEIGELARVGDEGGVDVGREVVLHVVLVHVVDVHGGRLGTGAGTLGLVRRDAEAQLVNTERKREREISPTTHYNTCTKHTVHLYIIKPMKYWT